MSTTKKKIDIVTGSTKLKELLRKRISEELRLTYPMIIANAKEDGIEGINKANLSKYFGSDKPVSGSISQKSLLYLSYRYGLIVRIKIGSKDYNEEECRKKVKALFNT